MICEFCDKHHPGQRGDPEERLLYSVMLLDATRKSFFCNPQCYEKFKLRRQLDALKKQVTNPKKQRREVDAGSEVEVLDHVQLMLRNARYAAYADRVASLKYADK